MISPAEACGHTAQVLGYLIKTSWFLKRLAKKKRQLHTISHEILSPQKKKKKKKKKEKF
jgi:hypothetical protein